MKLKISYIAIVLVTLATIAAAGVRSIGYPHTGITPSRIVAGDTVRLWLTLAQGTSSCVPTYPNVSYTVEQRPEKIYPPNFNLYLSYTAVPPPSTGFCLTVMTDYGPQFTFTGLAEGNYTCIDKTAGGSTIATFRVLENDSVHYTVGTSKTLYSKGQDLDVTYLVKNNSTRTKRFDFTSGCQYDMTLRNSMGDTVFHYMRDMMCGGALSEITLLPGGESKYAFPLVKLTEAYGPLTVSAQLIGYDASAVAKSITVNQITGAMAENVPGRGIRRCAWHPNSGTLSLQLGRGQTVELGYYSVAGGKLASVSTMRYFPAGVHGIRCGKLRQTPGLRILKVTGIDFTETVKMIF